MRLVALLMVAEIAFVDDGRIWSARADGSQVRPLTPGAQPTWSRGGIWHDTDEVYSIAADGSCMTG